MPQQAMSTDPHPSEEQGNDELRAELARQREEILRLRDQLIGKDAELGAAKGRLAEIEARSQRASELASFLESRIPGLGRIMGRVVLLLRSERR